MFKDDSVRQSHTEEPPGHTSIATGLRVRAKLDKRRYRLGVAARAVDEITNGVAEGASPKA